MTGWLISYSRTILVDIQTTKETKKRMNFNFVLVSLIEIVTAENIDVLLFVQTFVPFLLSLSLWLLAFVWFFCLNEWMWISPVEIENQKFTKGIRY
jgi:hypothetical protein